MPVSAAKSKPTIAGINGARGVPLGLSHLLCLPSQVTQVSSLVSAFEREARAQQLAPMAT